MPTNVPAPTLSPVGFVAPEESAILAGYQADINAAFGGGLNQALETPQGQLAVSLAASQGAHNDALLALFNQVDPAYSSGRMQDAIARIYYLTRTPAEPTAVIADCNGAVGTVIPAGSLARTVDGQTYSATLGGIIPASGVLSLQFANTVDGPLPLAPGALNIVYRAIPGWDAITNPLAGVTGRNVENPADFEARRSASVAVNARGTLQAIRGNVLQVPDVLDAYVTENTTATAATIGGVSIAARSLYVCVAGGLASSIARAIWEKKSPGCGYVGATLITVEDNNSGYSLPYPAYAVRFQIPAALPIKFAVSIRNSAGVPADAAARIKAALIGAFAGEDGGPRVKIGATLLASRYYSTVATLGPWAQILSILIGSVTPTANDQTVNIDQIPTLVAADITVTLV